MRCVSLPRPFATSSRVRDVSGGTLLLWVRAVPECGANAEEGGQRAVWHAGEVGRGGVPSLART